MRLSGGRITQAMQNSAAQMGIPIEDYYARYVLNQAAAKKQMSWLSPD